MKRNMLIILGAIITLVGLGFICPAIHELRMHDSLPTNGVALLFLGVALAFGGGSATFRVMKRRGV